MNEALYCVASVVASTAAATAVSLAVPGGTLARFAVWATALVIAGVVAGLCYPLRARDVKGKSGQ